MFGKNIPIKPVYESRSALQVISVFRTIQGEGPLAGEPAIFVRLAGCNLRCHFCDTEFTEGARLREIEALVSEVSFLAGEGIGLVVITGGEPLAQPITDFVAALVKADFFVQIETAGTIWQKGLERFIDSDSLTLVCSPKTPLVHPMIAKTCEHFKYIVRAGELDKDGFPSMSTQELDKPAQLWRPPKDRIDEGKVTIWLQPCDEYSSSSEEHDFAKLKRNIETCAAAAMQHGYRVSFQLHKVLGVE